MADQTGKKGCNKAGRSKRKPAAVRYKAEGRLLKHKIQHVFQSNGPEAADLYTRENGGTPEFQRLMRKAKQ